MLAFFSAPHPNTQANLLLGEKLYSIQEPIRLNDMDWKQLLHIKGTNFKPLIYSSVHYSWKYVSTSHDFDEPDTTVL